MTLKEIKKDLRRIKRFERALESKRVIELQSRERIEWLKKAGHSPKSLSEREQAIFELEATIKLLDIPGYIRRSHALKNKYIAYIDKLEEQDQELINLCYINYSGTQAQVAKKLNYSKKWLEKRLHEACERLCEVANNTPSTASGPPPSGMETKEGV